MRKGRRIATTAGATVLTFVALGGVAQADPLGDATGGLTDTLGGVLDSVTGGAVHLSGSSDEASKSSSTSTSRSTSGSRAGSGGGTDPSIGVGLNSPVHVNTRVRANSSPGNGTQADASVNAGVRQLGGRGDLVSASVNVGLDTCGFAPEACGMVPPPGNPPNNPPGPPSTPGPPSQPPPGVTGPRGAGPGGPNEAATSAMKESLPFTGGPIGALALIGLAAVLTGSAAVGGSRLRLGRDPK